MLIERFLPEYIENQKGKLVNV